MIIYARASANGDLGFPLLLLPSLRHHHRLNHVSQIEGFKRIRTGTLLTPEMTDKLLLLIKTVRNSGISLVFSVEGTLCHCSSLYIQFLLQGLLQNSSP